MYYARRRVGKGGLVLAPAVTRVQVLRNENIFTFQLTANIGFWGVLVRKEVVLSRTNSSWADDVMSAKIIIGRFG